MAILYSYEATGPSSNGTVENGHVLEQRHMGGGADLEVQGRLEGGVWTLVMKRKFAGGQPGDIAVGPGKVYNLGFAIHEDSADAGYHYVSLGYKLALDNAEADINAMGQ